VPSLNDIGVVFTCCMYPAMTAQAVVSVYAHYPELAPPVIAVDGCRKAVFKQHRDAWSQELIELLQFSHPDPIILQSDERVGAGRMIDSAIRLLDQRYVLTVEHGIRLTRRTLIERFLSHMPGPVAVGRKRANNRACAIYGDFVDPLFALFDRSFIVDNGLSFELCHLNVPKIKKQIIGVTTSQLLQYEAAVLGRNCRFVNAKWGEHFEHVHTPHARGKNASPHYIVNRLPSQLPRPGSRPNATLAYRWLTKKGG